MTQRLAGITDEWLAVRVSAGRGQWAARHLRLRGYRTFLPCYCERRSWSDRIKNVERVLFAGDVFCRIHAAIVATVVGTPDVIHIVADGSRAIPVPDDQIEAIQRIVEASGSAEPWPFVEGEPVRIDAVTLSSWMGFCTRYNDHAMRANRC